VRHLRSWLALAPALAGASVAAQASVSAGVSAGSAQLSAQRSEQAVAGVVSMQAAPWLVVSTMPSVVHVRDVVSGRPVTSNGLGDLPVAAAAAHTFGGPSRPTLASALTVVLPTGDASCGLGSGQTSAGIDLGFGASPGPKLHLSADASRSISYASSQSTLTAPRATSLLVGGGYDITPTWRADASLGVDIGPSDSTQALSRVVGGGVTHRIGSALALTLDGSVGLTAGSPKWVLTIGLGRVFAGTSPVALTAPLKRLRSDFTGGVNRQGGSGKIGCR
jgi:hypothetical protein